MPRVQQDSSSQTVDVDGGIATITDVTPQSSFSPGVKTKVDVSVDVTEAGEYYCRAELGSTSGSVKIKPGSSGSYTMTVELKPTEPAEDANLDVEVGYVY